MELLTYLLKVSACTVLFFGFYLLVLRRLTFFKVNRFYLLLTLVLSFVIPTLQFEVERESAVVETAVPADMPRLKPITTAPAQLIQPIVIEYQPEEPKTDWVRLIPYGYGGIALLLVLIGVWRLFVLLKYTKRYTKNSNGLKLIAKSEGFTNCSFFKYVFINEAALSKDDLAVLLQHEKVHAEQFHSVDKILMMIVKAVLWLNPIVYLYDRALEQAHEYEADALTSCKFGQQAYAYLLFKLATAGSAVPIVHNFVKSPVKDRIKMLFDSKSKGIKRLSYLLALPVLACLVWIFAVQVVYAQKEKIKADRNSLGKRFYKGTLKGKVIKIEKERIGYTLDLLTAEKTYSIEANRFNRKIKVGDQLVVDINGRMDSLKIMGKNGEIIYQLNKPVFHASKVIASNGKLIYERRLDLEEETLSYKIDKKGSAMSDSISRPQIISYSRIRGDVKNKITYMEGAVMKINNDLVKAESVEWDGSTNTLTANAATIKDHKGNIATVHLAIFDLDRGSYTTYSGDEDVKDLKNKGEARNLEVGSAPKVEYNAKDSVKLSKDRSVVYLFGDAELSYQNIKLSGSTIIYNQKTNSAQINNAVLTDKKNKAVKADSMYFDFATLKAKIFGADLN